MDKIFELLKETRENIKNAPSEYPVNLILTGNDAARMSFLVSLYTGYFENFTEEDIGENKAKVMFGKHENIVNSSPYPILTEKQMQGYDLVISCVDNLSLRKTLYNSNVKWLDLRAQGRNAALVSCLANPETYDTLLAGDGDRSYSCQGDGWDGSNEGVHFMQVVIAGMGAEWIQRWFNNEEVGDFKMVNI